MSADSSFQAVLHAVPRFQDVPAARHRLTVLPPSTSPAEATRFGGSDGGLARFGEVVQQAPDLAGQLDEELALLRRVAEARAIIEQAKGMLMAEHRVSAEGAFDLLRVKSQMTNTKLRDVAAHYVLLHSGRFVIRGPRRS